MCHKSVSAFVVLSVILSNFVQGYVIREETDEFSPHLRTLGKYQERLRSQGIYPKLEKRTPQSKLSFSSPVLDELEVLQLIPVTIKQLRQDKLLAEEREALEKIFGNIWELITEDIRREKHEPRNEILSVLLNSREIRLGKQEIRHLLDNDIQGNSIQLVFNRGKTKPIQLSHDITVGPPQRLLHMAAAVIQKAYQDMENDGSSYGIRSKRSSSVDLNNAKVTIRRPRKIGVRHNRTKAP